MCIYELKFNVGNKILIDDSEADAVIIKQICIFILYQNIFLYLYNAI